jgi:hypothetical protein
MRRRVAAEVSSLVTAEACEEVIEREHRIVLELLVTSREKLGAGPTVMRDGCMSNMIDGYYLAA